MTSTSTTAAAGSILPAAEFVAASQEIWNRRNADNGLMHEPPRAGQPNFLYARVRNRGTTAAGSVAGRAFHAAPGSNRTWPADWALLSSVPLAGSIASGGEAIIGPFEWTPELAGNQAVLVSVRARDDRSNLDSINQPIAVERLLHCDNNAALREMTVSPLISRGRSRQRRQLSERERLPWRNTDDFRQPLWGPRTVLD